MTELTGIGGIYINWKDASYTWWDGCTATRRMLASCCCVSIWLCSHSHDSITVLRAQSCFTELLFWLQLIITVSSRKAATGVELETPCPSSQTCSISWCHRSHTIFYVYGLFLERVVSTKVVVGVHWRRSSAVQGNTLPVKSHDLTLASADNVVGNKNM